MDFEQAYSALLEDRRRGRTGLSAERVEKGLGHAEQLFLQSVWWPAFGHFDDLYPEHKVHDFTDRDRYIDFAYIRPHYRIAIEIDGKGTHWQNVTLEQFNDHARRQNDLIADGWHVLRFTFDQVSRLPKSCQQTIVQSIGRLSGDVRQEWLGTPALDQGVLDLAAHLDRPIRASDVAARFGVTRRTASRHLRQLAELGWLQPETRGQRLHAYRLISRRRR